MTIRVIFWNVYCLPSFATRDNIQPKDRAKAILTYINDYDIVIMNEAWTSDAKKVFKTAYPYSYQTNKKCGKFLDSGLLVLSKYPIIKNSHILYTCASNWDWFASKGAIHVQISTPNGPYDFFTTHMQAGDTSSDQKVRPFQFVQLINFVNDNMPNGNNVYLIGDFNVMPLINGYISVHCTNLDDAIFRSGYYHMIASHTGLSNLQTGDELRDVYHVFSKRNDSNIVYHDSQGLTDGPYFTIDIPLV